MSWPSSENGQRSSASRLEDLGAAHTSLSPLRAISDATSGPQMEFDHTASPEESWEPSKISAYARLDFDCYMFFVQTLQVVLGRKSNQEFFASSHHSVDVHLSSTKAISRRHAKIFYNFGTQRFEVLVLGRNGAFVNDMFVAKGITVPLLDSTKIQIGDIPFTFVLPSIEPHDATDPHGAPAANLFNPSDALDLRCSLYPNGGRSPKRTHKKKEKTILKPETAANNEPPNEPLVPRRNSKVEIVRRLSIARRKSLASSSSDEINALLKELETFHGTENADSLHYDDDVTSRSLHRLGTLTRAELQKEEGEIDELVKQHNLCEGVVIREENDENYGNAHAESYRDDDHRMDIRILDQEVASLAPLIGGSSENIENSGDDTEKKLPFSAQLGRSGILKSNSLQNLDSLDLLRKHASGPRMGKPATIQPPANRTYGRQTLEQSAVLQIIGTSAASVVLAPAGNAIQSPQTPILSLLGFHVSPAPAFAPFSGYASTSYTPIQRPPPPQPTLEANVRTISSVSTYKPTASFRVITVDFSGLEKPPVCVFKTLEPLNSAPKIPLRRKDAGPRKLHKAQAAKDVPDQFKTKPTVTILAMISAALRTASEEKKGFTIGEIHEKIRDLFPYYRFCPDGWQFSVTHNVKFNKTFAIVSKPELESQWVYAIDDVYMEEKEKARKMQQEVAMAKAKAAAFRSFDYSQHQQNQQNQRTYAPMSRVYTLLANVLAGLQKPKSIAESASEIKRDSPHLLNKTPLYFQRKAAETGANVPDPAVPSSSIPDQERFKGTIKDQLAANRANVSLLHAPASPVPQLGKPSSSSNAAQHKNKPVPQNKAILQKPSPNPQPLKPGGIHITTDTMKSLSYLQKELFTLYKARNLTYNTTVTTEIITKALATTIAQVNIIGAKAGCGDKGLSFLVEKAPQQVSKILDIALTKSIKEKQGLLTGQNSRIQTPQPAGDSPAENTDTSKQKPIPPSPPTGSATPVRALYVGLSKPQSFTKPGAFGKPPQANVSNSRQAGKRPSEEEQSEAKKVVKFDD